MTAATQRTLRFLVTIGYHGTDAGDVGAHVWPERTGRITSSGGGGDYAAQMLLGRMKAAGLVEHAPSEGSTRWRITTKGRKAIEAST